MAACPAHRHADICIPPRMLPHLEVSLAQKALLRKLCPESFAQKALPRSSHSCIEASSKANESLQQHRTPQRAHREESKREREKECTADLLLYPYTRI
eukprot:scaffold245_cov256-Pinguiococcus_pyrenoidosus.AAC.24